MEVEYINPTKNGRKFSWVSLEVISAYLYGITTPFRTGDGAHGVTYILWFCTYFYC